MRHLFRELAPNSRTNECRKIVTVLERTVCIVAQFNVKAVENLVHLFRIHAPEFRVREANRQHLHTKVNIKICQGFIIAYVQRITVISIAIGPNTYQTGFDLHVCINQLCSGIKIIVDQLTGRVIITTTIAQFHEVDEVTKPKVLEEVEYIITSTILIFFNVYQIEVMYKQTKHHQTQRRSST